VDQPTYTVSELSNLVAAAMQRTFPDEVWVQGEIRDLTRSRNGHVYFSLVEPGTDGTESLLPVTLFASERYVVNRVLMRSGGAVRMTDGIRVRIRGRLGLYAPRSSVQLRMTWIDTDFTLGQLAAERQALIAALTADGSLVKNGSLPMPLVPLRVGLVTSGGSAAHADFVTELHRSEYAFSVVLSHATVQGTDAPVSIAEALERLGDSPVDVIAVVRGGGAQTDLATFDTELVARAIAGSAAPVLTGIGHETDQTVADLAAFDAMKTPTACAQRIVAAVRSFVERLDTLSLAVERARRSVIVRTGSRVDHYAIRLRGATELRLAQHRIRLETIRTSASAAARRTTDRSERRLRQTASHTVRTAYHRLGEAHTSLIQRSDAIGAEASRATVRAEGRLDVLQTINQSRDPATMFARGWSVTLSGSGRPVRDPAEVEVAERLRTVVEGGTLTSVVVESEEGQ